MKKNIVWVSSALAIVLAFVLAGAQSRRDFSGTWVVDVVERPDGPARGPGRRGGGQMPILEKGQRIRIKQTPERLIVTAPGEAGEQMNAYALDGSETTDTSGRGAAKTKTRWDGAALVTEGTRTLEGPRGAMTLKTREVRSLSEDGRTMTLRTTIDTPRGQRTSTVTFLKVEE